MADNSDKTEKPTAQHLAKARRGGNIPRSKELSSMIILLSGWGLFMLAGTYLTENLGYMLSACLSFGQPIIDFSEIDFQPTKVFSFMTRCLFPIAIAFFTLSLLASLVIGGVTIKEKIIRFDFRKFNIFVGIKRILSPNIINESIKIFFKILLVFTASGFFFIRIGDQIVKLMLQSIEQSVVNAINLIFDYALIVIFCLIPVVAYDVLHQMSSYYKKTRMSKSDIKKELKDQEGDPQIKGRIRQIQQSVAQRRMMLNLKKADVIINNPTHISIALQYRKSHVAPIVIAKGRGEIALNIRKIGQQHSIPMLEAAPLARALYKHCELEEVIPSQLYMAVAQVLSWVYSIKQWNYHGGVKPQKPRNIPIPSNMDCKIRE